MQRDQPEDKDSIITTTVAFDRASYKRLKLLAVERDTNVRNLIREAVVQYLKRRTRRRSAP